MSNHEKVQQAYVDALPAWETIEAWPVNEQGQFLNEEDISEKDTAPMPVVVASK